MYIKLSERTIPVSDGYIFVTLRSLFYDSLKNNDILIDDFRKFEIEDEEYNEGISLMETPSEGCARFLLTTFLQAWAHMFTGIAG
jgi:hypothetical protein